MHLYHLLSDFRDLGPKGLMMLFMTLDVRYEVWGCKICTPPPSPVLHTGDFDTFPPVLDKEAEEDKDLFIGPQEFVVGYSKALEQPQSSGRSICHFHAMTRMGHEPATIHIAA